MNKGQSQDTTIWTVESTTESVIDKLTKVNSKQYNLLKAAEELQELSLALTQKINKPSRNNDEAIIDEIGDVIIRIKVLKKLFNKKAINTRVDTKLKSYQKLIDKGLVGTQFIGI